MNYALPDWQTVLGALDQDVAIAPFARGGMAIIWSLDGRTILANNELAEKIIGPDRAKYGETARERLRLLGQGLAPYSGVRLERLRLPVGRGTAIVTCACRRIRLGTGEQGLLVVARAEAPDIQAPEAQPEPAMQEADTKPEIEPAIAPENRAENDPDHGQAMPDTGSSTAQTSAALTSAPEDSAVQVVGGNAVEASAAPAVESTAMPELDQADQGIDTGQDTGASRAEKPANPAQADDVRQAPAATPGKARRVVWQSDHEDRIIALSPELIQGLQLVSPDAVLGQRWQDLAGTRARYAGGRFLAALATRQTIKAESVLFRIGETDRAMLFNFSASPVFDAQKNFTGYRGFGVLRPQDKPPEVKPQEVKAQEARSLPDQAEPQRPDRSEARPPEQAAEAETSSPDSAPDLSPDLAQPALPPAKLELSTAERNAFRQIAQALGARLDNDAAQAASAPAETQDGVGQPEEDNTETSLDNITAEVTGDVAPASAAGEETESTAIAMPLAGPDDAAGEVPPSAEMPPAPLPEIDSSTAETSPEPAPANRLIEQVNSALQSSARKAGKPPAPASDGFGELMDKLPIGVLVNRGGDAVYANRTFLDLLGYADLDEIRTMGGLDRLFRGPAPDEGGGAVLLVARDGDVEAVEARLSAISWRGKPSTLLAIRRALDGEAQVKAEDAIAKAGALELDLTHRSERLKELSAILDTATDGVITLDERGRVLSLNSAAEALFGYDQREVTGEIVTLLLAPESHLTALDYLDGLKGGGVASIMNDGREVQGVVRQGGKVPLFMTMGQISDGRIANGGERKFCAVLRDITAWKQAEAELTEARKAAEKASAQKSDVLAKISHEIRTPLNAIIGFSEVMAEERFGPLGSERYKEYARDIRESGGYLISLVNDLLDLAKIEAGRLDLDFVSVNLNEIATSAVALLQPEATRNRVVLRSGLSPKLPPVVADERSLRQIIINLLSNAVKFTDAGGQVIVSTALGDHGEAILRVRDTGIGMSEKDLKLALEPFRQVSTTRRGGGTGLGLPLTKALVEANRGSFVITSIEKEGTLAEVIFPPQRVLAS